MAIIAQAEEAGRGTECSAPTEAIIGGLPMNGRLSDLIAPVMPYPRSASGSFGPVETVDSPKPFDPAAWLSSLVAIGGGYALASGRKLWLVVDHCPADELTSVMSQVVGHTDRVEAVRVAIERHQAGELA